MAVFNGFCQGLGGEVLGTLSGVELTAAQIYGIGAVLHRGLQGLHGPGRGK